jgi:hypothetical protein
MPDGYPRRRRSITGALILITLGLIFLYANLRPEFDPWSILARYWPLLLIFWGIGRIVDYFVFERVDAQGNVVRPGHSGEVFGILVLIVLVVLAMNHSRLGGKMIHVEHHVDRGAASSMNVSVELSAGDLDISGGAAPDKLLEGDFNYREHEGAPEVNYSSTGKEGSVTIRQGDGQFHTHWGTGGNQWTVRLNKDVASDLKVEMGAGKSELHLAGMNLGHVDLEMGAGRVEADLTGDWKRNVEVSIEGGVGSATIRLPKNIGVEVHASGGIGAVDTNGLRHENDDYVNDQFGKSPVTMRISVEGGVGHSRLVSGD